MPYFTLDQLTAIIPISHLTEGLDDDGNGVEDAFLNVQGMAENRVNGLLAARYAVPIPPGNAGADAFLADVTSLIAAAMIYTRRGVPPEQWPFKGDHSSATARLRAIAKGDEKLIPALPDAQDASVVISEPAGSWSSSLSA
ncbi:MAG: phage protein Gp36 family protein [Verrucomicrobiota bacterium]